MGMTRRWGLVIAALAAATLLGACSAEGTASPEVGTAEQAVAPDAMPATDQKAGAPTVDVTTRQVIRTGYVSLTADDVRAAASQVRGAVTRRQGVILNEDVSRTDGNDYATITAQVPADQMDAFIDEVAKVGDVDSVSVSASDVTMQVVDLDARISALRTSVNRLTQLLAEASRVEDLLAAETQLSQRQAELDSLTAQRTYLADQVAMSTVTVSIAPRTEAADAPGFLSGVQDGWSALLSLGAMALTAAGFLLPFLVILLIVAVPVIVVIVRRRRRHVV